MEWTLGGSTVTQNLSCSFPQSRSFLFFHHGSKLTSHLCLTQCLSWGFWPMSNLLLNRWVPNNVSSFTEMRGPCQYLVNYWVSGQPNRSPEIQLTSAPRSKSVVGLIPAAKLQQSFVPVLQHPSVHSPVAMLASVPSASYSAVLSQACLSVAPLPVSRHYIFFTMIPPC